MKPKNDDKKRKIIIRVVLVLLVSIVGLIICGLFFLITLANSLERLGDTYGGSCNNTDTSRFEAYARVSLPPNYDNFQSFCGGMQGWGADAVFDIPPDELDLFLSTTHIDTSQLLNGLPSQIHSMYFYDRPQMPAPYLYATYSEDRDWFEEIIVDTTHPNRWTVYFTVLGG